MTNAPDAAPARPSRRAVALLLLVALVVRGGAMAVWHNNLRADPDGYRELATVLGSSGGTKFSHEGRVAYRPPLYPWLLFLTGAYDPHQPFLTARLHVILGVVTVWLTVRLGTRMGMGNGALLAGGLVAVDPLLVHHSTLIMSETLAALMTVATLDALAGCQARPGLRRALWCGTLLGLCCLCRPTFLVFAALAGIALPLACAPATTWRSVSRLVVPIGCGAVLLSIVGAWTWRNYLLLGRPVVGTTHGGYTLYLANNPVFYAILRGDVDRPSDTYDATLIEGDVSRNWQQAWNEYMGVVRGRWGNSVRFVQRPPASMIEPEVRFDGLLYRAAYDTILDEPVTFLRSCLYRLRRFWGLVPNQLNANEGVSRRIVRYGIGAWYGTVFALALVGVWQLARTKQLWSSGWLFGLLMVASFMAVHTFYWTDMRMRAPVMPVVVLAAAAGAAHLWRRRRCVTAAKTTS